MFDFMSRESQDIGFTILHLLVIGINVFAWILPATRRLHRIVLFLTTISWIGMGAFYGWGYCFLTDWHWDLKRSMGERGIPPSFPQYILHNKLGLMIDPFWTDVVTGSIFVLLLGITFFQLLRERRQSMKGFSPRNPPGL